MEYCNGFYRDQEATLCVLKELLEDAYEQTDSKDKSIEFLKDKEIDLQKLKDKYLPLTSDKFIIRIYSQGRVDGHDVVLPKYDILLTRNAKITEMKEKLSKMRKKKSQRKSPKKFQRKSPKKSQRKSPKKSQRKSLEEKRPKKSNLKLK